MNEKLVKKCVYCQRCNEHNYKYRHLPLKEVYHFNHWDEVCVDMIGPWKITINNFKYAFRAITCIYSVIALPEVIHVDNTTANIVAQAFEASWLS